MLKKEKIETKNPPSKHTSGVRPECHHCSGVWAECLPSQNIRHFSATLCRNGTYLRIQSPAWGFAGHQRAVSSLLSLFPLQAEVEPPKMPSPHLIGHTHTPGPPPHPSCLCCSQHLQQHRHEVQVDTTRGARDFKTAADDQGDQHCFCTACDAPAPGERMENPHSPGTSTQGSK